VDTTTDQIDHLHSRCLLAAPGNTCETPGLRLNRRSSHACSRGHDELGCRKWDGPMKLRGMFTTSCSMHTHHQIFVEEFGRPFMIRSNSPHRASTHGCSTVCLKLRHSHGQTLENPEPKAEKAKNSSHGYSQAHSR